MNITEIEARLKAIEPEADKAAKVVAAKLCPNVKMYDFLILCNESEFLTAVISLVGIKNNATKSAIQTIGEWHYLRHLMEGKR